ncbi:hypothetical protein [uncultured Campylobacter sp.]|uniref:hypothetical protein n=1 Tax=uncultured Campylobacter sp. TaxID=218934 RepID=UPI0026059DDF|nr:hypothetical protein [uncultured Campylobacter sp.]
MDTDMAMIAPYAFHNGDYHAAYHRAANATFTVASLRQKKLSAIAAMIEEIIYSYFHRSFRHSNAFKNRRLKKLIQKPATHLICLQAFLSDNTKIKFSESS